uniref:SAP domain-containing protein n=1 Tax=Lepeophtheirus salmonis TaxID=72036 RepID=A0A0K2TU17_LEPSM
MDANPTPDELRALRVVDLRQKLSEAGLPQGGIKVELIQRLSEHYAKLQDLTMQEEEESKEGLLEKEAENGDGEEEEEKERVEASAALIDEEEVKMECSDLTEEKDGDPKVSEESGNSPNSLGEELSLEKTNDEQNGHSEAEKDVAIPSKETPKVFSGARLPAFEAGPLQQPPSTEDENFVKEQPLPIVHSANEKLPQALEEAFAFKKERALLAGVQENEIPLVVESDGKVRSVVKMAPQDDVTLNAIEEDDEKKGDIISKRHKKKKKKRRNRPLEWAMQAEKEELKKKEEAEQNGDDTIVEIEYIHENIDTDLLCDPKYRQYVKIFETFKIRGKDEMERTNEEREKEIQKKLRDEFKKVPKLLEEDDLVNEVDEDDDIPKLSKRKLKKLNRLSVAELKQLVDRPDVVEMHDVTAWDPRLLVHLKSTRNSVPVPRHWCFKRKYLQGKRGIEKPPFDLPDFIKKTGIMEMRAALQEKEESKGLKSKMREKVRPKLGKIDIDYQKLHDAFFKWQTKPRMTGHGDLYYEGKEFEIRLKEKKPGDLSDDLRTALGMPVGPNAHKVPPPWLIAMQRYGPPPSYPNLKIPGLNAPIPDGCSFGYHAGGWGKPPVDETGKPLYGDVFGTSDTAYASSLPPEEIDRSMWGEMESESEEEEEESEEEEGDEVSEEVTPDKVGIQTPVVDAGLATPSGMSSVGLVGGETPELLELRKKRIEADMESSETPNLYTVIPEKRNDRIGSSMMGSTHTYDLTGQGVKANTGKGPLDTIPVELALNPEEVDLMDTEAMQIRAEAAIKEQQASLAKEDFSDMVAEHAAKQSNKRKRLAAKDEGSKSSKKYKEFKF